MSRLSLTFAFLVVLAAPSARAADPEPGRPSAASADLPVIEVIARPLNSVSTPVQTLDAEDLEPARIANLADALDLLPGVTITQVGARSESLVNVRGFDSRQVPLFIDGIPQYVPYDGNLDLSRLGVRGVDSIRVTRAGGSVLYGPNSEGGAINVITARPEPGLTLSTRAGVTATDDLNEQRQEAGLTAGYGDEHWYVQGSAYLADQDFWPLPSGEDYGPAEDGGRRNNSSTRDLTSNVKIGWRGDGGADWQLAYNGLNGKKDTPPYAGTPESGGTPPRPDYQIRYWQWPYYDKDSFYLAGAVPVAEPLWLRTRIYYDSFKNSLKSFDDDSYTTQNRPYAFNSNYDDYTWGGSEEAEWSHPGDAVTRAVVSYKRDVHREVDNTAQPEERQEDATWSLAAEHQWPVAEDFTAVAGLGWNALDAIEADNNVNGVIAPFPLHDETAWNAQAGLRFTGIQDWILALNLASKTRFPTLKDRYSYRLGAAIPNPGLGDERANQVEVSARGDWAGATLEVALYGAWISDAIELVTLSTQPPGCTATPCLQNQNVGRQRNLGWDVTVGRPVPVIGAVQVAWSYLNRDNLENPALYPVNVPRNKLRVSSRTPIGQAVTLTLDAKAESSRYGNDAPLAGTGRVRKTAGFGVFDGGLAIQASRSVRILLEGSNLFDHGYSYDEGYPEPGRTWSATVLWAPGPVKE